MKPLDSRPSDFKELYSGGKIGETLCNVDEERGDLHFQKKPLSNEFCMLGIVIIYFSEINFLCNIKDT